MRQIDQIRRRVLEGESIPHEDKVFSMFQAHTEWISQGKVGVPVALGVKVCVIEDQHRFISPPPCHGKDHAYPVSTQAHCLL